MPTELVVEVHPIKLVYSVVAAAAYDFVLVSWPTDTVDAVTAL